MDLQRRDLQRASNTEEHYKKLEILAKGILAAAVVAGVIASGIFYTSGAALFAWNPGDVVSESDRKMRIETFEAIKYLTMQKVSAADLQTAVDSMHLSSNEQLKLQSDIEQRSTTTGRDAATAHAAVVATPDTRLQAALPLANPVDRASQPVLVWVRLWDTDVEDGDVVRIESGGYSRTVTLTKNGITIAVPVSASGQMRISGIRDGDGGGITVGLGSGSTRAILPIMSVGQVLTLNVRTN